MTSLADAGGRHEYRQWQVFPASAILRGESYWSATALLPPGPCQPVTRTLPALSSSSGMMRAAKPTAWRICSSAGHIACSTIFSNGLTESSGYSVVDQSRITPSSHRDR